MSADTDYRQAVLRLPLRQPVLTGKALYVDTFDSPKGRLSMLDGLISQAARSVLFLKSVETVTFTVLSDTNGMEDVARVQVSPNPPEFRVFLDGVKRSSDDEDAPPPVPCQFDRTIRWDQIGASQSDWAFRVKHVARFDDPDLKELRHRLKANHERAIPWVALAIPKDGVSMRLDGTDIPSWRVFLPLNEPGPCSCVLSAALFVGPSRQKNEYRTDGSDEAQRKTRWNEALAEKALVPLLAEASLDVLEFAPDFVTRQPKDYLALFPVSRKETGTPSSLTEYFRDCFNRQPWVLRIPDVWDRPVELTLGTGGASDDPGMRLETVPDWLAAYRDRFMHLSTNNRRFMRFALGEALRVRISGANGVIVDHDQPDVAKAVLSSDKEPIPGDIKALLDRLARDKQPLVEQSLMGLWCFQAIDEVAGLLRFDAAILYLFPVDEHGSEVQELLNRMRLDFEGVRRVSPDIGLPAVDAEKRREFGNLRSADKLAALEMLRRVSLKHGHDTFTNPHDVIPLIDFLCGVEGPKLPSDMRLPFLVRTAQHQNERRVTGLMALKPTRPSSDDEDLWTVFFGAAFPHIEPQFASQVQRLLAHAPLLLGSLRDAECEVAEARSEHALGLLLKAQRRDPGMSVRVQKEIDRHVRSDAKRRASVERATGILFSQANRRWDELDSADRSAFLALPIHRRSDGAYGPLVSAAQDADAVAKRYRLQSKDDVRDAPIELAETELLQAVDPTIKSFYRLRLGIEDHGRTAILKQVLRQVGTRSEAPTNRRLLEYLAKYFCESVETLSASSHRYDQADATELRELFALARTVPCVDGQWYPASECVSAQEVADRLIGQGWRAGHSLEELIGHLFPGKNIQMTDRAIAGTVRVLYELSGLPSQMLAETALASDSPDLTFKDRLKILIDNWGDRPRDTVSSSVLSDAEIPCADGDRRIEVAELVSQDVERQFPLLARILVRGRVLRAEFANRFSVPNERIGDVMRLLGVKSITAAELDQRLVERFAEEWGRLDERDRPLLLQHVHDRKQTDALREKVQTLAVVHVGSKPAWVQPTHAVSPKLLSTKPPLLDQNQRPKAPDQQTDVEDVWNVWCGIRDVPALAAEICEKAKCLPLDRRPDAARQIADWVEKLAEAGPAGIEAARGALATLPWVLAKCGGQHEFRRPTDILVHKAGELLEHEFWVPHSPLPQIVRNDLALWGFVTTPPANIDTVRKFARCLCKAAKTNKEPTLAAYGAVSLCLDSQPDLIGTWEGLAAEVPVFRLFRDSDQVVTSRQLFLGNQKNTRDVGESLFCLCAQDGIPKSVEKVYRDLGINEAPSAAQVSFALSSLDPNKRRVRQTHGHLVRALKNLAEEESLDKAELANCRVRTCSGSYRPLHECVWDEELGRPGCFTADSENAVVDATDEGSREFCHLVDTRFPAVLRHLRVLASPEILEPIVEIEWTPAISQVLGPWRDWLSDLARPEARLRHEVEGKGLRPPVDAIHVVPVERVSLRYVLDEDTLFAMSAESVGPMASHDCGKRILVRRQGAEDSYTDTSVLDAFDAKVAEQLADLLCQGHCPTHEERRSVRDLVSETLDRPSVALERMKRTQSSHFLHQYHDQVADPDYAVMFEEYQRTKEGTAKYSDLESRMWSILREKYVAARREQIRGLGYDEFSVLSELLQNAEDAYMQRHHLGMPTCKSRPAKFTYVDTEGGPRRLLFEHFGRPFNYWRHGPREVIEFSRDVEGVLRSQGSFKAKTQQADISKKPVGRFGLGFKSIYLLTDSPRVHSGSWHFEIEAGCLPREITPPADLSHGATRIEIPLRPEAKAVEDPTGEQLTSLMPFLREIDSLELRNTGCDQVLCLKTTLSLVCEGDRGTVERVAISGASYLHSGTFNLLRVRHPDHAGQLALYLGEDGLPSPWDEAFSPDLYVVLPLKTRLGVGVGISHLFEIQSGRTHLVDPAANKPRFADVARLVHALPRVLEDLFKQSTPNAVLTRFWGLWRWDVGDEEARALRSAIAQEVALLPLSYPVVPTVGNSPPVKLGEMSVVYFSRVPDRIQEILIAEKAPVLVEGRERAVPLDASQVVTEAFALAYMKACKCAGIEPSGSLSCLNWETIGECFQRTEALAKNPALLNRIAEALEDEKQELPVLSWLTECPVAAGNEPAMTSAIPSKLLQPAFQGSVRLPKRLLLTLSPSYSDKAQTLLRKAGLRTSPSGQDMKGWIQGGELSAEESLGILRYLAEDSRFMNQAYRELNNLLRLPWFPDASRRLTAAEAAERFLAEEAGSWNTVLKAWLGMSGIGPMDLPPEPVVRRVDPAKALAALSHWWKKEGAVRTREYETRTYPLGTPPQLRSQFFDRDRLDRKQWLTLLMLGALHTMGRTTPVQNRDFLTRCEHNGWMNVFADPEIQAHQWMGVLEQYLDEQVDQSLYYYWMQQFVRIFQLAKWLPEYVEAFLAIDRVGGRFSLSQITVTRSSELFRGGGVDAPPLTRTLGNGACFVLRELLRLGVLSTPHAHRYCYVPSGQVRNLLMGMGSPDLFTGYGEKAERSPAIYDFLIRHLGEDRATFGGSFDIPLQIVASDPELQQKLLGEILPVVDEEESE